MGPRYHAGQEGVEALQAVAASHGPVVRQAHAVTGDILGDGVHVSSWRILNVLQVFLLVFPDPVNGCCILEQMDLVLVHSSRSLQDVDGTLHADSNRHPPDVMLQIRFADVHFNDLTIRQRSIFGRPCYTRTQQQKART